MNAPSSARAAFDDWRTTASDWWTGDDHLRSLLTAHGITDHDAIKSFARVCGETIDPLVRENNRDENLPRLRRYDDFGNRTEAIKHHPTYRAIGRLAYKSQVMTLYGTAGHELEALARTYLFAQNGEGGHACPMACTAGLIKVLRAADNPRPDWMARLLDHDYDNHYRGAQFLTEIQGGSDVGANAVSSVHLDDGSARLTGEKWFCSVIDADLFLVTARPQGAAAGTSALQGYVVPRRKDDGTTNDFHVRRLKYKLGTRSMASAEVDFVGAWALPIADFRTVMEQVIDTSRLMNAVCCSAILERARREATTYAQRRLAFGKPIAAFPSVAQVLADLTVQTYAARGMSFALAALGDRVVLGKADQTEAAARRMLVNLNKFWTSLACTAGVRQAIEVLGGNGAIEEFSALPRLLRDAIVLEAWEGGHNVLCTQVLRDTQRLKLHEPMFAWLEALGGPSDRTAAIRSRWETHLTGDADGLWAVRGLCTELAPIAQATVLGHEARRSGSDPRLPAVVDHLLATSARNYDPITDRASRERVARLIA